jgi:hypothetical protein
MTAATVHPAACVVGRHRDAEQTEFAAFLEEPPIERARAVVLVGLRLDRVAREITHRFPQKMMLLGRSAKVGFERESRGHG